MALTFGGDPKLNAEEKKLMEKARKLRRFRRKAIASGGSLKKKLIKEKARKAAMRERYKRRSAARAKGRTTTRKKG